MQALFVATNAADRYTVFRGYFLLPRYIRYAVGDLFAYYSYILCKVLKMSIGFSINI